ncbi:hypothetical protein [Blastopirellula marina]|nr:hypothetical protein [Blastopirellula marina]
MKNEVFDRPEYLERYRVSQKHASKSNSKSTVYGPLKRLSKILTSTICISLFASVAQITIGLIGTFETVLFCYSVALIAIGFVFFVLWLIACNLSAWFKDLDERAEDKLAASSSGGSVLKSN